jgi:hypothetical protein
MKFNKENINKNTLNGLEQYKLDQYLIEACLASDLNSVKYLLTSPELNHHANIKGWDEEAFICACRTSNIELINYMLRSPELKEHSNIHTWQDMVFIEACDRKDIEVLNYLIFDYKIDATEQITKFLEKKELTQIAKILDLGEGSEPLTKDSFPKDKVVVKYRK